MSENFWILAVGKDKGFKFHQKIIELGPIYSTGATTPQDVQYMHATAERKRQCNFVEGSVSPSHDDQGRKNLHSILQKGVFRRSRGPSHKTCFWGQAPRPPISNNIPVKDDYFATPFLPIRVNMKKTFLGSSLEFYNGPPPFPNTVKMSTGLTMLAEFHCVVGH